MRKFFEKPEMMVSMFDAENVATTARTPLTQAQRDVADGTISLTSGTNVAQATKIFEFTFTE